YGVVDVVTVELEPVDQGEREFRPVGLGDCDGPIERYHGARRDRQQLVVEQPDLPPIGGGRLVGIAVNRVDGGLDLVGTRLVSTQQAAHDVLPLGDQVAVPERSVLRSEEHTSELQSRENLVCRLLLEKKKNSYH